jgi:diguanylate cyclase (GGDEF)-like protein
MDSLTGLGNRRFLEDLIDMLRGDWALITAVMIDIDHFKAVNDTHGHQAGDEVLKVVAERLKNAVVHPAEVGRYGGDEFLILVPDDNVEMGEALAERARVSIEAEPVVLADGTEIEVTVSAGAASGASDGLLRTIAAADTALYAAKEQGRNRVVSAVAMGSPA